MLFTCRIGFDIALTDIEATFKQGWDNVLSTLKQRWNDIVQRWRTVALTLCNFVLKLLQRWTPTLYQYCLTLKISRSKGNETMKYNQLIEYNMRTIFLKNSYSKCGGETVPRNFPKKSKLSISLDHQSKFVYSLLSLYAKLRAIKICWN